MHVPVQWKRPDPPTAIDQVLQDMIRAQLPAPIVGDPVELAEHAAVPEPEEAGEPPHIAVGLVLDVNLAHGRAAGFDIRVTAAQAALQEGRLEREDHGLDTFLFDKCVEGSRIPQAQRVAGGQEEARLIAQKGTGLFQSMILQANSRDMLTFLRVCRSIGQ